ALARLPRAVRLRVVGYETIGSLGYQDILRKAAEDLNVSERVEILGVVPTRAELLQRCRESDIGLAFTPMSSDDVNMVTMAGASNKAFDYLACGLAVVVSDRPEWTSMFVQPGYGVACDPDDTASIERALRLLIDDQRAMRAMGERGRRRIECDWNYEQQFAG